MIVHEKLSYYVSKHEGTAVRRISEAAEASGKAERVDSMDRAQLVWLNTATCRQSKVRYYNHVTGSSVLENKAKLAVLQERMAQPSLESFVVQKGESFFSSPAKKEKRYMAKDPTANSGVGLWFVKNTESTWDREMVIQKYIENPRLWQGRKAQYRCYAILKAGGEVWIYKGRILQVCSRLYETGKVQDRRAHVTNVAENIDDLHFIPEMPEYMSEEEDDFIKIAALMRDVGQAAAPFLLAPSPDHFELCGFDIIFDDNSRPWLIEINCPPNNAGSKAQGPIEAFHSLLYRDLLNSFVRHAPCKNWIQVSRCAKQQITPALSSKFKRTARWRHFLKLRDMCARVSRLDDIKHVFDSVLNRTEYFEFYASANQVIFLENAGGSQVPRCVTQAVAESLSFRWREVNGSEIKARARSFVSQWSQSDTVFFGANATAIFRQLSASLKPNTIVCCCEESHNANNAETWGRHTSLLVSLVEMLTTTSTWPFAHVYAIPHASNLTGEVYNLERCVEQIRIVNPQAFIVCDGVAIAPHRRPATSLVDAYVVAFHKCFGPHLAACCCPRPLMSHDLFMNPSKENNPMRLWEPGSLSTEALAGVVALFRDYFCSSLHGYAEAYISFRKAETVPFYRLLVFLASNPKVHILSSTQDYLQSDSNVINDHLPVVAFVHATLPPATIVEAAAAHSIAIRAGDFLAPRLLARCSAVSDKKKHGKTQKGNKEAFRLHTSPSSMTSAVRVSLAHYNTLEDMHGLFVLLASLPGWQGDEHS